MRLPERAERPPEPDRLRLPVAPRVEPEERLVERPVERPVDLLAERPCFVVRAPVRPVALRLRAVVAVVPRVEPRVERFVERFVDDVRAVREGLRRFVPLEALRLRDGVRREALRRVLPEAERGRVRPAEAERVRPAPLRAVVRLRPPALRDVLREPADAGRS